MSDIVNRDIAKEEQNVSSMFVLDCSMAVQFIQFSRGGFFK